MLDRLDAMYGDIVIHVHDGSMSWINYGEDAEIYLGRKTVYPPLEDEVCLYDPEDREKATLCQILAHEIGHALEPDDSHSNIIPNYDNPVCDAQRRRRRCPWS
jgi:hypothetical protein